MRNVVAVLVLGWGSGLFAGEIRGTVVDAATGTPLPCRLYARTAEGQWLFAKSAEASGSALVYDVQRTPQSVEKHVTLSPHPFVVEASGPVSITAELGKEYHPATTAAEPGQTARIALKRWIDMPARGWYSGDTHVHRKPEDLPNLMPAEDLHVAFPPPHGPGAGTQSGSPLRGRPGRIQAGAELLLKLHEAPAVVGAARMLVPAGVGAFRPGHCSRAAEAAPHHAT